MKELQTPDLRWDAISPLVVMCLSGWQNGQSSLSESACGDVWVFEQRASM